MKQKMKAIDYALFFGGAFVIYTGLQSNDMNHRLMVIGGLVAWHIGAHGYEEMKAKFF